MFYRTVNPDRFMFQPVPEALMFDKSVSVNAKAVYCYVNSAPYGMDIPVEFIAARYSDLSVDDVREALGELVRAGWLVKGCRCAGC